MLDRFNKAKRMKLKFNSIAENSNEFLLRNNSNGRIYYVQNYKELVNVIKYLLPHIKDKDIKISSSNEIEHIEYVIEYNGNDLNKIYKEIKPLVVRSPEAILGLR